MLHVHKKSNIEIKRKIDVKINLSCHCIGYDFEKFGIIDKKRTEWFIKSLEYSKIFFYCLKNTESKNPKVAQTN